MAFQKGREKTGGRVPGEPNKATAEIKALAQAYGPGAIEKLAALAGLIEGMPAAEAEQARIAAAKELLDRGYGKPSQVIAGDPNAPLFPHKVEMVNVKT